MSDTRWWAGQALLGQAAAVAVWWPALWHVPRTRVLFLPQPYHAHEFDALVAPDLLVLALSSAVAGVLALRGDRRAGAAALVTCGASLYATVYSIRWALEVGAPLLSPALMIASTVLTIWCARRLA